MSTALRVSTAEETRSHKLSSELQQLVTCDDPERFARDHGISLINHSLQVTIATTDGFPDIEERYKLKEVKRHKNFIEAIVPIEELVSISKDERVRYIRRPHKFWKWLR